MPVLAAIDIDMRSDAIISEAKSLADAFDEELHVIHANSLADLKEISQTDSDHKRTIVEQFEDEITEIASPISDVVVPVCAIGQPATEVVEYAKRHDVIYVVIGGRRRSPVQKAIFGSTAQKILLNAPCSVVVTLPES